MSSLEMNLIEFLKHLGFQIYLYLHVASWFWKGIIILATTHWSNHIALLETDLKQHEMLSNILSDKQLSKSNRNPNSGVLTLSFKRHNKPLPDVVFSVAG